MIHIDGDPNEVLARFAAVPGTELNTLATVEDIFGFSEEIAQIFASVVGVRVETAEEIRRGVEMARASRHGDLLSSSACAVSITGSSEVLDGYLFEARGELWLSVAGRRLLFRLLPGWEWKSCILKANEIEKIFIKYYENGSFEAKLQTAVEAVLSTGALCDFIYGAGPSKRTIGALERPERPWTISGY